MIRTLILLAVVLAVAIATFPARQVTRNATDAPTASVIVSNGVPTLQAGTYGTTPSLAPTSIDGWGTINLGTGISTGCTLNFSKTLESPPHCIVGTSSAAIVVGWIPSTTNLAITLSLSLAGGKLYYFCPM